MKDGKCPKCGSKEVYLRQYKSVEIFEGVGEMDKYACMDCGYSEEYVVDKQDLQKVKQKWKRVG